MLLTRRRFLAALVGGAVLAAAEVEAAPAPAAPAAPTEPVFTFAPSQYFDARPSPQDHHAYWYEMRTKIRALPAP